MNLADFDAYVQRLQNLTPFSMLHPTPDGEDVVDWFQVTQQFVLPELIIQHLNIPAQVDLCPAQLQTWGRYKSIAQRAVDICQRRYRCWRDAFQLKALETAERSGEKKPTSAMLEMMYRQEPEYRKLYQKIEQAEEALNAITAVYEAFKVKANLLGAHAPMYREMAR